MSALNKLFRTSALIAAGSAALTLTACASSGADRYGNVYDYEGGKPCVSNCAAAAPVSSRYGDAGYVQQAPVYVQQQAPAYPRTENVVYADCSVIQGMNCAPQAQQVTVYQQPAQTYTQSTTTYETAPSYGSTSYGSSASCPAGTVMQSDGTCMQSSYSSATTTDYGTSYGSTSYGSTSYSGQTASCPSGTSLQSDGTCMQSSYSSSSVTTTTSSPSYDSGYGSSYSSGSSYGSASTYSGGTVSCPAGTTSNGDGTCAMNEGMSAGNITIYNDPIPATGGYTQSGGYVASDYRPVRK